MMLDLEKKRRQVEKTVVDFWYRKPGLLAYALLPLSWLFCSAASVRKRYLVWRQVKPRVPVIIVGNLTVGGAGKTPLVIKLARFFTEQGYQVGVISRGYGATIKTPQLVNSQHSVQEVGDEALEIFFATGLPVCVSPDRVAAAKILEKTCQLIISDDGLQHYRLGRTVEIAVVAERRLLGNGFCLPAGPLREPPSRLRTVDFVVCQHAFLSGVYTANIRPLQLINVADPEKVMSLEKARGFVWRVVAAIADPQKFIDTLDRLKIKHTGEQFFPDHFNFTAKEIDLSPGDCVIMTGKDAVKCRTFADDRYWYLAIDLKIEDDFLEKLATRIAHEKAQSHH